MDFDNSEFIIQKGYDSCNENIPDLVAFLENRGIYPSKGNLKTFDETVQYHERWSSLKKRIPYTALPMDKKGNSSYIGLINWKSYNSDHYLKDDIYLEYQCISRGKYKY